MNHTPIDWDKLWQGYKDREADEGFIKVLTACFWIGLGSLMTVLLFIFLGWY